MKKKKIFEIVKAATYQVIPFRAYEKVHLAFTETLSEFADDDNITAEQLLSSTRSYRSTPHDIFIECTVDNITKILILALTNIDLNQ